MLRDRNSMRDVIYNWFIMLTVIMPMAVGAMLGYVAGMLYLLGVI